MTNPRGLSCQVSSLSSPKISLSFQATGLLFTNNSRQMNEDSILVSDSLWRLTG